MCKNSSGFFHLIHNKFVSESRWKGSPQHSQISWHRTLAWLVVGQKKRLSTLLHNPTQTPVSSAPATKHLPAAAQPPRLLCSPWSLAHPTYACNADPSCFSDGLPQPQQSQHAAPHTDPYKRYRHGYILLLQHITRPSPGSSRLRRRRVGGAGVKPTMGLLVATHHHHHHPPAQKQRGR